MAKTAAATYDRPKRPRTEAVPQLPITAFADWDRVYQLRQMLQAFEGGQNLDQAAIFADAMLRDDRINGTMATRVGALVASDMEFKGATGKKKATKIAEVLKGSDEQPGIWDDMCPQSAVAEMIAWGLLLGIAVGELVWNTDDPANWIPVLRCWHPQFLRWDWNTGRYYLQTGATEDSVVMLPDIEKNVRSDGHWVIWFPFGYRNIWRRALIRPLAMPYLCRQWSYRDWARYNEKHGSPVDIAKVPEGAPEEEKAQFRDMLANRGSDTSILLPQGATGEPSWDVSILEATGNSYQSFQAQLSKLETDIAVCVLGQNLSTEVQGGSRAAAEVHDNVRLDKRREDAGIASCFRKQILSWWAQYNYGDPALAPRAAYLVDPPKDKAAAATTYKTFGEALQALQLAGLAVDVEAMANDFGIPLEVDEVNPDDEAQQQGAPTDGKGVSLTPSAISAITTVNEARKAVGLGPLSSPTGALDPDGELTVAEFQAKHAETVATAAAAEAGSPPGQDPAAAAGAQPGPAGAQPDAPGAQPDDGSDIEIDSVSADGEPLSAADMAEAKRQLVGGGAPPPGA